MSTRYPVGKLRLSVCRSTCTYIILYKQGGVYILSPSKNLSFLRAGTTPPYLQQKKLESHRELELKADSVFIQLFSIDEETVLGRGRDLPPVNSQFEATRCQNSRNLTLPPMLFKDKSGKKREHACLTQSRFIRSGSESHINQ